VALLKWEAAAALHRTINEFHMYKVRDGRVDFKRTDIPELKDQMPVAGFLSVLRAMR
jgi:hypothetical protein